MTFQMTTIADQNLLMGVLPPAVRAVRRLRWLKEGQPLLLFSLFSLLSLLLLRPPSPPPSTLSHLAVVVECRVQLILQRTSSPTTTGDSQTTTWRS
jgi:hypothetical protein